MKSILNKLVGSMLAVLMVFSMMPMAAFASEEDDVSVPNKSNINDFVSKPGDFEVSSDDNTASASTSVDVMFQYDDPTAFKAVKKSTDPLYIYYRQTLRNEPASSELWVETVNGAALDSSLLPKDVSELNDYTVTWKRIEVPNENSAKDPMAKEINNPAEDEWDTDNNQKVEVLSGSTSVSDGQDDTILPDNENYKNYYRFTRSLDGDTFEEDRVYFYRVEITSSDGQKIKPVDFKVVCYEGYWGGTINDPFFNELWAMSGYRYPGPGYVPPSVDLGFIYKGSWLEWEDIDPQVSVSTYNEFAQAVSRKNEEGKEILNTLAGAWNVMIDAPVEIAEPLYVGTVMMTFNIPDYDPTATYSLLWKDGAGNVVSIPSDKFVGGEGSARAGFAQVNDNGTITFLLEGTSQFLGAFALVKTSKTDEPIEKYTITTKVLCDVGGNLIENVGGSISPANPSPFTVGDGITHTFLLNALPGYIVKSLTITKKSDEIPTSVVRASDPDKSSTDESRVYWTGNRCTLPSKWSDDATLTVTFAKDTTNETDISAKVRAGANGSLYVGKNGVDANKVESGSTAPFATSYINPSENEKYVLVPGKPFTLYFAPDSGYRASKVTVSTLVKKDGGGFDRVVDEYLVDGDETFTVPALKGDATITVEFAESLAGDDKQEYGVSASVLGEGGTVSFDGSEGDRSVSTEVTDGSEVTVYLTAKAGYTLKSAEAAVADGIKDGNYADIKDLVSEGELTQDGTMRYILKVAPVKSTLALRFAFEQGPIQLIISADDGATVDTPDGTTIQPGSSVNIIVMPDSEHDVLEVTVGGKILTPTKIAYDQNGNPVYVYRITYADAQADPHVWVKLKKIESSNPSADNILAWLETVLQVIYIDGGSVSVDTLDKDEWQNIIEVEPNAKVISKDGEASFTLKIKDKNYVFRGASVVSDSGTPIIQCYPIVNGKVSETAMEPYALGGDMKRLQINKLVPLAAEAGVVDVPELCSAYYLKITEAVADTKMTLVLETLEDFNKEKGTDYTPDNRVETGELRTLYIDSGEHGAVGLYDRDEIGVLDPVEKMEAPEGTSESIAIVPNRGYKAKKVLLYSGQEITLDSYQDASYREKASLVDDRTQEALDTGFVQIAIGATDMVLYVEFTSENNPDDPDNPVNPDNPSFHIAGLPDEHYEITSDKYEYYAGEKGTFKVNPKINTDNLRIQNVITAMMIDGHEVWPDVDTSYFSYSKSGALIITETGEKVSYDPDSMVFVIDGVAASHTLSAEVMRAVGVEINYSAETGIVVPNGAVFLYGKVWWPLDENDEPTEMTLYAAAYDGYEILSFKVNNDKNSEKVGSGELLESNVTRTQLSLWADGQDNLQLQSVRQIVRTVALTPQASDNNASYGTVYEYKLTKKDFDTIDVKNDIYDVIVTMTTREATQSYPVTVDVAGGDEGHGKVWVDRDGLNMPSTHLEFDVDAGSPLKIELEPDNGYGVSLLTDNEEIIPTTQQMKSYTIEKIDGAHAVQVTYSRITGSSTGITRFVKVASALAKTGDYNLPILLVLIGVACGSLGVALISHKRSRRRR